MDIKEQQQQQQQQLEWYKGNVETNVYKEINQCPIIAINLENDIIQEQIKHVTSTIIQEEEEEDVDDEDQENEKQQLQSKLDLDSDNSDNDTDDIGEHLKTHDSKIKMVFGDRPEFNIKPVPCERTHKTIKFPINLALFEKFSYN